MATPVTTEIERAQAVEGALRDEAPCCVCGTWRPRKALVTYDLTGELFCFPSDSNCLGVMVEYQGGMYQWNRG